ncbi:MAG: CHASE2 domain-containing protein [Opitutaceae bacterium]|nr:CHASE2 domain-containing protein [Cytophagales bacterium]
MSEFFRKIFSWDNIFATIFIFAVMWIFSTIKLDFDALNPVQDMFGDFEITDLVSSRIREEQQEDTNIVIINIGTFDRATIAQQVKIVNTCQPKVIGIDSFFRKLKPTNPEGDSALEKAFSEVKKLVLVTKLHYNEDSKFFDSLETSHPIFLKNATGGSANLITEGEEKFRTARVFSPFDTVIAAKQVIDTFFAVKLAEIYKPGSAKLLSDRNNEIESIRYKGNIYGIKAKYFTIEAQDILDGNFLPDLLKNKIIIMGFLGREIGNSENIWDEDKFFTPLNDKYVGKAVPDMFGVVVHANIISMILNNTFVNETPKWIEYLLTFCLCFVSVVLFHFVLDWIPQLFDPFTKFLQFLAILILIGVEMFIYYKHSFRVELGIALGAIALAPDLLEIYLHVIKKFVTYLIKKVYITNKMVKQ